MTEDTEAQRDFAERLASIERGIEHMADTGGVWPRDVRWLVSSLRDARQDGAKAAEHASMSWECLEMVREVLAAVLGEEHMKGVPPMFYPEAIRSAMYQLVVGKIKTRVEGDRVILLRDEPTESVASSGTPGEMSDGQ